MPVDIDHFPRFKNALRQFVAGVVGEELDNSACQSRTDHGLVRADGIVDDDAVFAYRQSEF